MNQTSWYVLEETNTFGVIKVRNLWDKTGDPFDGVFIHMLFEEQLLDPVLETFVGEDDAKLIEGVGTAGHVLGPWNIEETDESGKVVFAEPLINMFVQPGKEKRMKELLLEQLAGCPRSRQQYPKDRCCGQRQHFHFDAGR